MSRPEHDRNRADRVLGRALDELVADGNVDEGIALLVYDAEDVGVLEEQGRALVLRTVRSSAMAALAERSAASKAVDGIRISGLRS
jgi:hypothetical protein